VAKDIDGALGLGAFVDEFETAELAQLIFGQACALPDGTQQAQWKFAADHCGNL
jgi:hypothetical protein